MTNSPHFARALVRPGRDLLEAPLRRPWLVLGPTALAFLAATAVALLLPPRYRAVALVRVDWAAEGVSVAQRLGADPDSRRLSFLRLQVLSRPAMERVLEEAKPFPAPGREGGSRLEPVERLRSAVTVKLRGADAFAIEYVHADPEKAALVPNRLASFLVAEAAEERARRSAADPRLLEARLVEARTAMEEKAAVLHRLREGGASIAPAAPDPGRRERPEAEKRAVALDLSAAMARAEGLRLAIAAEERPSTSDASGPSAELARLQAERAELRQRYTEEHPDVEALNRRIRRLETAGASATAPAPGVVTSSLRAQLDGVEAEIETLRQQAARLDVESAPAPMARPARDVRSGLASKRDLEALTRDYEQAQRAFLELQDQWNAVETASRLGRSAPRFELGETSPRPGEALLPGQTPLRGRRSGGGAGAGSRGGCRGRDPGPLGQGARGLGDDSPAAPAGDHPRSAGARSMTSAAT